MPKQTFLNLPAEKRESFLQIALAEFAEHDYQSASISRIVARAGIAKGSFYQYFANKEALYRYLLELGAQEKAAFFQAAPPDAGGDLFAYLRQLLSAGIAFEANNPLLSQIGYRAVKNDQLSLEFLAQARSGSHAFFTQLVAEGQRQGRLDRNLDEDLAAFVFSVLFMELGRYLLARLPEADEEGDGRSPFQSATAVALIDQLLHLLEFGMGQRENDPEEQA